MRILHAVFLTGDKKGKKQPLTLPFSRQACSPCKHGG
jgi:hypothetical protein